MHEPQSATPRPRLRRAYALSLSLALLSACGSSGSDSPGGDGGGGGGPGNTELTTLSGLVLDPTGTGLANVTVSADGAVALSNAQGQYVLNSTGNFPIEDLHVVLDGSTAGLPGQYPEVGIDVDLPTGQASATVPQVITLPDLLNPESSNQTVMTAADGSTDVPVLVTGTEADMVLSGPIGTIITVNGSTSAQAVELNMTPVDPGQVPMLLPDNLLGGGFVTIQPGESTFDPPGAAAGLDAMLPNDQDLPVGSSVDIWSFDHDEGAWVNRSDQTGQQGTVVDLGGGQTAVQATGVITEGGWHTSTQDVDPDCATTFTLRAVDTSTGAGVPGVIVQITSTGQVGITGADGRVSIPLVWAYDVGLLASEGVCLTTDLSYFLFFPIEAGFKTSGILTIPAASVVAGGVTDAGDYDCDVPTVGTLSGIVLGTGATTDEPVRISNASGSVTSVVPAPGGTFFVSDLEAGDYTATFDCVGDEPLVQVSFSIEIGQVTSVVLQCVTGTGGGDVTVVATQDGDLGNGLPGIPLAGATVTLQGTDSGSAGGLVMITDIQGRATFTDVSGPFNVTVQDDMIFGDSEARIGHSLIGVSPINDSIGVVVQSPELLFFVPVGFGFLTGDVLNPPNLGANEALYLQVVGTSASGEDFRLTYDLADGSTLSGAVPANLPLDYALIVADVSSGSPVPVRTAFFFDQGSVPIGQAGTPTLDWGAASKLDWDLPVSVTLDNLDADISLADVTTRLSFRSVAEEVVFQIDLNNTANTMFSANLPDVTASSLAGIQVSIDVLANPNAFFFESEDSCSLDLDSNENALTLAFPNDSTWIQPTTLASFTIAEFQNLLVTWMLDAPAGPDGFGMEHVQLFSGVEQGNDPMLTWWAISSRAGTTGFQLPPRALPMTEAGQSVFGNAATARFDAQGFDFDTLHNEAAATNLEQLYDASNRRCQAGDFVIFSVVQ